MTTGNCLYCGAAFQAKRSTKKFCKPAHRLAYFKDQHDPLRGTEAAAARKAAWLDKQQYGNTKKWTTIELAKRGLGFDGAGESPGRESDLDQDPKRPYDIRWIRRFAKRDKRSGDWRGEGSPVAVRLARLRAAQRGPWDDRGIVRDPFEDSVLCFLRAVESAAADTNRELAFPELEVVLWHVNMRPGVRDKLSGFFEGDVRMAEALQVRRKLEDTLDRVLDLAPKNAHEWLEAKNRYLIPTYQRYAEVMAERNEMTPEVLERLDRLESGIHERLDRIELRQIEEQDPYGLDIPDEDEVA